MHAAAGRARHLRGEQPDRARPDDEHRIAGADAPGWQRLAAARERLGHRCRVRVEPVGDAMQIARRDEQPRSEPAVDERADRAPLGAQVDPTRVHHTQWPQVEKYVSVTTRVPPHDGSTPSPELRDDAGDLVPHRHRRP